MDGFLHSNCTSTVQEYILLHQPDVGVDDEKELLLLHNKPLFVRSSRVEATTARDDSLGYRAEQAV